MRKVLIVDDEPNIVLAIKFLMENEGFVVQTATDGRQAIDVAKNFVPDVMLLDVMMPFEDGYSVARKLRSDSNLDATSIIFLTAKGTSKDKMEGYDSGAEHYIVKPFDNDELVEMVKDVLCLKL
ncbi:MAG: response regulator [Saprospiraceae bacterium]|nr:response regulator [Saprospiraceae bacterium]